ncbi:protein of unknown function DUF305 [Rhizobium sp. PDO1-076]|uniref:CopM family metallochaperone n=1 Tax=Rhizobium sp. PDO1-076 TaxID=1125979 RepID=UPI00024E3549|nr:DUF305 domain-containing protein [Rhizobium sp. PDO1-076]EHS53447.1 protein of unknown function DUF305 [Rhizobium sp. PDO1-076]
MLKTTIVAASLALALTASFAIAQDHTTHQDHMMPMGDNQMPRGDTGPSSQAFKAANDRMHADMAMPLTGNADVDFVRGMIPHHQGAIDMARIVLEHGKDPEIRKLAEDVIQAQEGEIAMMKDWLAKNGQ